MAVEISSWEDLQDINTNSTTLSDDYILTTNLDENSTGYDTYASSTANSGSGWLPIGDSTTKFTGTFDGNGHTISDLYIDRSSYVGLFGGVGEDGLIENIGVVDVDITGESAIGGLVGHLYKGDVSNSYSTGDIAGNFTTGGLIGYCYWKNSVSNSYSTVNVTRISGTAPSIGAFVGGLLNTEIKKSYAIGSVYYDGTDPTDKGFVGNDSSPTYSDNFFDSDVSNQDTATGATAKSTTEMKDIDTFTDTATAGLTNEWDMVLIENHDGDESTAIWFIDDGVDYPRLWFEFIAESETNFQINIGDSWKGVDSMKINIGDEWKNINSAKINIGDEWKTIF